MIFCRGAHTDGMTILYVGLAVYILAVNFYAFRLLKTQKEGWEAGGPVNKGDGKLILAALLGGAIAVYASMFALRYRLENILLMIAMPLLAVLNVYCFVLGFRGIWMFF